MPKKKITIEEALQTLHNAGLRVKLEEKEPEEKVILNDTFRQIEPKIDILIEEEDFVKVTLFAKHSISCGNNTPGSMYNFGPGICIVPKHIAKQLLHQDMLAAKADKDMLDPTPKSFLIVTKRDPSGRLVDVKQQVSESIFSIDFESLNNTNHFIVR